MAIRVDHLLIDAELLKLPAILAVLEVSGRIQKRRDPPDTFDSLLQRVAPSGYFTLECQVIDDASAYGPTIRLQPDLTMRLPWHRLIATYTITSETLKGRLAFAT